MKKKNNKKYIIFAIIIIVVISLIGIASMIILAPEKETEPEVRKNIQEIEGYGYTIDDEDTKLYKDEFKKLKKNLTGSEVNEEEYARSIARMFIIDLYTINNKINKYDIGGLEFILESNKENYTTNVTDTIYKYVEDNTYKNRKQTLPVVSNIEITDMKNEQFKINEEEKEYDSYRFNLSWNYETDLGYDKTAELIVIKKDNKMYVVEKN